MKGRGKKRNRVRENFFLQTIVYNKIVTNVFKSIIMIVIYSPRENKND